MLGLPVSVGVLATIEIRVIDVDIVDVPVKILPHKHCGIDIIWVVWGNVSIVGACVDVGIEDVDISSIGDVDTVGVVAFPAFGFDAAFSQCKITTQVETIPYIVDIQA
jgi:hypothetical protein